MKISRVVIDNYRNLKHVDVILDTIVTLIGENNSGKSNFLRAISLPLTSDETGLSKRLSWYDINKDAKKKYYDFLEFNRNSIINGSITVEQFLDSVPSVTIQLFLQPEETEHYFVNDILNHDGDWLGGIRYQFSVKKADDLLYRVKYILDKESADEDIQMSLLPMELFEYSITVPDKGNRIPYDTLSMFRTINLPAERDNFSANADRLGSKALSDLLKRSMGSDSQVKIEKAYKEFFNTVRAQGQLDTVLNWQEYGEIDNAQEFFRQINILPNMPQMDSILGSIRLGYEEENMFVQGLGHRNLVLIAVLLNSYINKDRDAGFRLLTLEEPEAHLCVSNVLLMTSLLTVFSQKNRYTQLVYSTHNSEFVNKIGLDNVVVLHNGEAFSLKNELTEREKNYLVANPNTDIFKLLYSKKTILVEGITEELLLKSYFQTSHKLNDIKVLSFHKGFTKIIDIWKKVNLRSENKLGVVRDSDNEPRAQNAHEQRQDENVIVRTTDGYTLETDITDANYDLLKSKYGDEYGWTDMSKEDLQKAWREKKTDVMLRICNDLVAGSLEGFSLPRHIQEVVDFVQGGFS